MMAEGAVIFLLVVILAYGRLNAVGMPEVLSWFVGIAPPRNRFYGVGILNRKISWPTSGTWEGQLGFLIIGSRYRQQASGEWRRKGRVVVFWSTPKRKPKKQVKPRPVFG